MRTHERTFEENFHMSVQQFDYIFERTEKLLVAKKNTRKDNIEPKQKLAITLELVTHL